MGETLGVAGGSGEEEMERRVRSRGGRHVMAMEGGVLVDGADGYT